MSEYCLFPSVPSAVSAELAHLTPHLQQLLYRRNITDKQSASDFLEPDYERDLHDPFLLNDMDPAVCRIELAIKKNEHILIFSDYDCDGIPGAVVLHDFFTAIGYSNFSNKIPHRHFDGFGLNIDLIKDIQKTEPKPTLIITIDCGTTDSGAVKLASEFGIDVIITDHHEPKDVLPEAVAVVNPKVGNTYPFSGLCGAGVVFKLVQALIIKGNYKLVAGYEKWWLDMVGLATVADMVPLLGENRALAHYGLTVLRKSRRPGLQQLLKTQKANQSKLTEDDIGFTIGPRINAASRMDNPEDAFFMLATKDEGEAGAYVNHLEKLNQERKTAVALMTKDIHKRLKLIDEVPPVLVMGNPDWRPSLVGLAASKLAEEYNRPVFLWGRDGNEKYKGSARGGGRVSVINIMEAGAEVFLEFGGHHMSGGFTVLDEYIHNFGESLNQAFLSLGEKADVSEPLVVDMELNLDDIDNTFIFNQNKLAPFGHSNPKPVYLFSGVTPNNVSVFGKAKDHTKLEFETNGLAKEAICFFKTPDKFAMTPKVGQKLSLLAELEQSFFMGRLQTRLRIVDIV